MEKYLLYILLIAALVNANAQNSAPNDGQVAYYKQTGVVRNGTRTAGDNTGQFISFTFAGCYDSNNQRHEVGNGFLAYKGPQNDMQTYNGRSYWGENTGYYFSADFKRLNIYAPDGLIYVYEKTNAPAGVVTSAKIYVKPAEPRREEDAVIAGPDPVHTDRWDNGQIIPPPPPPPPDHTVELRRLQERYTRLKQLKAREEQRLEDTYRPVIDSGIAKGYFDNRNGIRETIRLYERQMSDIQREARNLGGSVY